MWSTIKFADMKKGETVVDLGSGAGIDVFLHLNWYKERKGYWN